MSPAEGLFLCLKICVKPLASLTNPGPGPGADGLGPRLGPLPRDPRVPHGLREHRAGPTRPPSGGSGLCLPPVAPLRPQVKQLRLEREREKAMREQELEMLQREKEAEHFKTWEEQEDNFHLQQAKLRYAPPRLGAVSAARRPLSGPNTGSPVRLRAFVRALSSAWSLLLWLVPLSLQVSPNHLLRESLPDPPFWGRPPLCAPLLFTSVSPVESRAKDTSDRSLPCVVLLHERAGC